MFLSSFRVGQECKCKRKFCAKESKETMFGTRVGGRRGKEEKMEFFLLLPFLFFTYIFKKALWKRLPLNQALEDDWAFADGEGEMT